MLRAFLDLLRRRNTAAPEKPMPNPAPDWFARIAVIAESHDANALDALCREATSAPPSDGRVWQRLGRLKAQSGDLATAETFLHRALASSGETPDLLCDLANIRQLRGNLASALETYRQALALDSNHELSLLNAASLYLRQSDKATGRILLDTLFTLNPRAPGVAETLAQLSLSEGSHQCALRYLIAATEVSPADARLYAVMGATYNALGQRKASLAAYQRSLELNPSDPPVANNLGLLLFKAARIDEAIAVLEQAVAQKPDFVEAMNNLAIALQQRFAYERAEQWLQRALGLRPEYADVHTNLGKLYVEQGRTAEAEQHLRAAVDLQPSDQRIQSNLLLCLNYLDHTKREALYRAHVAWAKRFRQSNAPVAITHRGEDRRKLRIGYLSPDFVTHSVAFFLEPILRAHNRDHFDIFCYSNNPAADNTTARLQALALQWRDVSALDDAAVIQCIRDDQIDILVDLAGHTSGNRLLVMLRRPAPVQVTYLGYPNTTGLTEIDYRITDDRAESADAQQYYTETLFKLPRCFLSYQPPIPETVLDAVTSNRDTGVVFGAFNNLAKVTEDVVVAWAAILRTVSNSVLHLPGATVEVESVKQRWIERFASHGVAANQIKWIERTPSVENHLERYRLVDIALDTYPYNGTTTTMDALWMGVPVVTRYGSCHASRVSYDLLSRIGLEDLVATTFDAYIDIAVRLAQQGPRDSAARHALRQTLRSSELLDGQSMAVALEQAYRQMWQRRTAWSVDVCRL